MSEIACRQCGKIFRAMSDAFNGPYCTCPLPAPTFTTDSAMTPPDTKTPRTAMEELRNMMPSERELRLERELTDKTTAHNELLERSNANWDKWKAATQRIAELEAHAERLAERLAFTNRMLRSNPYYLKEKADETEQALAAYRADKERK